MNAKPFEWQKPAVDHLCHQWEKHPVLLDASDTGVGKTYISLFVLKKFGLSPFIVCPKAVIPSWKQACEDVGVQPVGVSNLEKLKTGRTPWLDRLGKGRGSSFSWTLPAGTPIVFDEAHICGGFTSQNRLVMEAAYRKYPALLLSATLADNPLRLRAAGRMLGLHNGANFFTWAKRHGCTRNPFSQSPSSLIFNHHGPKAKKYLVDIHEHLFPERGVRLRVEDLDGFPENAVFADTYDISRLEKKQLEALEEVIEEANEDKEKPAMVLQNELRQAYELAKVPIFFELGFSALKENHSVVCFFNFREPLAELEQLFAERNIRTISITGDDKEGEREEKIAKFQSNEVHVALVMVQAGGLGISLHDLHGRPRTSLISPPYSSVQLKQALGRIHRAGSKSKAVQRIVYLAGTVEEKVCRRVREKLKNLDALNDGDLHSDGLF